MPADLMTRLVFLCQSTLQVFQTACFVMSHIGITSLKVRIRTVCLHTIEIIYSPSVLRKLMLLGFWLPTAAFLILI